MKIISHRGESNYAPENTMSAFYLAYLNNTDGIELDIRKTKDNVIVINHDKTIDRTSNGAGKIENLSYSKLLKYDFGAKKEKKFSGEKIVTLDDFLKYFSDKNIIIYIEIKEKGYEGEIVDLIKRYCIDNIVLISFKYEILEKIYNIDKAIKLGWLLYEVDNNTIKKIKKINIEYVLSVSICLGIDDVEECHNNKLKVGAWGILGKDDLKRLKYIKADYAIFDSYIDAVNILEEENETNI